MNRECKFREAIEEQGQKRLCCSIGVNFYFVGDEGEFCRICTVPDVQHLIGCQYIEPFAVLRVTPDGTRFIKLESICTLKDAALRDLSRCALCPAYEEDLEERHPRSEGTRPSRL